MKSGTCPKCESDEVYVHSSSGPHGLVIPIHTVAAHPTSLYVCRSCGYLEIYALTGADLDKVREKFKKVKDN